MIEKDVLASLSKQELTVYHYVEANKDKVKYMRIRELAQETGVSTATILRFTKKLGMNNYHEFKYWCKGETKEYVEGSSTNEILECIQKLNTPYYEELIQEAVDIIQESSFVIFAGIGNSGGIAHYGARSFTNAGTYALCQDDPFYRTSCVKGNPVVIVLTVSGETTELIQQLSGYRSQGCPIICITTSAQGTIAKLSDYTIAYHLQYRSRIDTDFSSQLPAVHLIEMMTKELMRRK